MSKPFDTTLLKRIKKNIENCAVKPDSGIYIVGFSGGADSTALLVALHELGARVRAVHLHHGLRPEAADKDAKWCESFCKVRNIDFECHYLNVDKYQAQNESVEAAARRLRLAFWRSYVAREEFSRESVAVLLGHHADDSLEDLFLRLGRGSNTSGLTGLRMVREMEGVTFFRPLLNCRREELETFLLHRGITEWRQDHTNRDTAFRRNAIRHKLLPVIKDIWGDDGGFMQSLSVLREDAQYLESKAADYVDDIEKIEAFRKIPKALQPRALRLWIRQKIGVDVIPSASSMARLRYEVRRDVSESRRIPLGKDTFLIIEQGQIKLDTAPVYWEENDWHWRKDSQFYISNIGVKLTASVRHISSKHLKGKRTSTYEYFLLEDMPSTLQVRPWLSGDRMIPFGHQAKKKIKDIFQEHKIPRSRRSHVPIVLAGDDIIWLAGVQRSALFTLPADQERPVLKLEIEET